MAFSIIFWFDKVFLNGISILLNRFYKGLSYIISFNDSEGFFFFNGIFNVRFFFFNGLYAL